MSESALLVALFAPLLLFGVWILFPRRPGPAQSEVSVTTDVVAEHVADDDLPADIPRWLSVSAAIGVLLGAVLLWATGGFGDSDRPRHYPGSSDACIAYRGSPYVFDDVVSIGALVSPLLVLVWILWALIGFRGDTRWVMFAVGFIFAFDAALALWYASQLYMMRGGCS